MNGRITPLRGFYAWSALPTVCRSEGENGGRREREKNRTQLPEPIIRVKGIFSVDYLLKKVHIIYHFFAQKPLIFCIFTLLNNIHKIN
jgi:hypothetical protein